MLLNNNSSFVAVGGVCAALSMVFLLLASAFPFCRLAFVFAASVIAGVILCSHGNKLAAVQYTVVTILSLLFLPNKSIAVLYAVVVGNYPMVKRYLERIPRGWIKVAVKLVVFNAYMFLCWVIAVFILNIDMTVGYSPILLWIAMLLAFTVYDYIYMTCVYKAYSLINKI